MLGLVHSLGIIVVPMMLYQRVMVHKGRLLTKGHCLWTYAFVFYLWLVLLMTGVGSLWDFVANGGFVASVRHANFCWWPFGLGVVMTSLLNVLLFMPLGFLLPHIWVHWRNPIKVTLMGYLFSAAIELAQIPTNRAVDVEDLLMNTLGTFLGFLFWKGIGNYLLQGRVSARVLLLSRSEPLVYLMLAFFMPFFFLRLALVYVRKSVLSSQRFGVDFL